MIADITKPRESFTVSASAGSGKTYILVKRLIRLLIESDHVLKILVLTFSRKASSQLRVNAHKEVLEMAKDSNEVLKHKLKDIGLAPTLKNIKAAKFLYHRIYYQPFSLQIKTFHSFFHDILNLVPNKLAFRINGDSLEYPGIYHNKIFNQMKEDNVPSLYWLLTHYDENLVHSLITREGLTLQSSLALVTNGKNKRVDNIQKPNLTIFIKQLYSKAKVLEEKESSANMGASLLAILSHTTDQLDIFELVPLIKKNIATKNSQIQKKLAKQNNSYIDLWDFIVMYEKHIAEYNLHQVNYQWSCALDEFGRRYKELKNHLNKFDYSDLEIEANNLINNNLTNLFIEYKLYCRINHILVDEFQDTSPLQWHILSKIIKQFIFSDSGDASRSTFLVGDSKQMIYGFRGALPDLQNKAFEFLQKNHNVKSAELFTSYRSSPVLIDFFNTVFRNKTKETLLEGFNFHSHEVNPDNAQNWGRVEIWDRFTKENDVHSAQREGEAVASKIREMIDQKVAINGNEIRYQDIMILRKNRNKSKQIEYALRKENIPFISDNTLDVFSYDVARDILCFIRWVTSPDEYNFELMTLLRSPYFNSSFNLEEYEWVKKRKKTSIWRTLINLDGASYSDIRKYLHNKILLAKILPPHDLLSRTIEELDMFNQTAFYSEDPEGSKQALKTLLDCSLNYRSGRYPSIKDFYLYLESLKESGEIKIQSSTNSTDAVQILTIHSAKGLESEIVFVIDLESFGTTDVFRVNYQVDYRLDNVQLKDVRLDYRALQELQDKNRIEDANLMYVALTRAKSLLICSSNLNSKNDSPNSWYSYLINTIQNHNGLKMQHHGQMGFWIGDEFQHSKSPIAPERKMNDSLKPKRKKMLFTTQDVHNQTAPNNEINQQPLREGTVLHKMIELFSNPSKVELRKDEDISLVLKRHGVILGSSEKIEAMYDTALALITSKDFEWLFKKYDRAEKEFSVASYGGVRVVPLIIDRIIWYKDSIVVVDFKKEKVLKQYFEKLRIYQDVVKKIYPNYNVTSGIVSIVKKTYHPVSCQ